MQIVTHRVAIPEAGISQISPASHTKFIHEAPTSFMVYDMRLSSRPFHKFYAIASVTWSDLMRVQRIQHHWKYEST